MRFGDRIRLYGVIRLISSDCAVYTYVVDLNNRENIKSFPTCLLTRREMASKVKKEVGSIDILVNNGSTVVRSVTPSWHCFG